LRDGGLPACQVQLDRIRQVLTRIVILGEGIFFTNCRSRDDISPTAPRQSVYHRSPAARRGAGNPQGNQLPDFSCWISQRPSTLAMTSVLLVMTELMTSEL